MKNIDKLITKFKTDEIAYGAMYILPDGRMLDLSLLENGHAEFWEIVNCSAEELKANGWLRLNTKLKYVELPSQPTAQQMMRLKNIFDLYGDNFQIK